MYTGSVVKRKLSPRYDKCVFVAQTTVENSAVDVTSNPNVLVKKTEPKNTHNANLF